MAVPEAGRIFDIRPIRVEPLSASWPRSLAFPRRVYLGRARESRPSERLAFLIHGFALNEDYFGLLAPQLIDRGYDVSEWRRVFQTKRNG